LQQKKYIDALLNGGEVRNGKCVIEVNGTSMSYVREPVIDENMENLVSMSGQKGDKEQSLRIVKKECRHHGENVKEEELTCFEEAIQNKEWADAMTKEYQSIISNDVWEIVPRPKSKDVVSSKWLYKIKHDVDGSIEKYKARFIAHGFSQKEDIDYEETFPPVARYTSIITIIALATKMKWKLHQMDVKTTFLNGVIEEAVYIEQPQGFEVEDKKTHVCRLKKAMYGSKQAPRAWYGRVDSFLTSFGFTKSKFDYDLYFNVLNDEPVILLLYVEDLFLIGEEKLITDCKKKLAAEFEMKDLGLMHYFLGLEVWQSPDKIFLNQGKYAVEILKMFDLLECKSMNTVDATLYRQIIGSLMYLMNTSHIYVLL
jgi:hypothetical protein